jgi:hypothetical protein
MPPTDPIVEVNVGSLTNLFKQQFRSKTDKPMAERDAAGLPYTDKEHIQLLQREYESAAVHGGREAIEKCFK